MLRKIAQYLLIAAFLAALFLPHVLWSFVPEAERLTTGENRTLAEYPTLTPETIAAFPKAWEAWYDDHLPFRKQLVNLNNQLSYFVFRTSTNDNVVLGRDNWLFYNNPVDGDPMGQYTGETVFSEEEMILIADKLTRFRDMLEEQGKEFVVFIAPNKARVYSEYLPEKYGEPAWDNPVDKLTEHLSMNTDLRIVTAIDPLLMTRYQQPELPLYYATDTHWNALGAYVGAQALLWELGYELPSLEDIGIVDVSDYGGDLAIMLGLGDTLRPDRIYGLTDYAPAPPNVIEEDFATIFRYETPNADDRKLFVIRDSFCTAMAHYLASQFAQSTMVHTAAYTPDILAAEDPDIVVLEMVERYCSWPYINLLPLGV